MPSLLDISLAELESWLLSHGQAAYRARQIRDWVCAQRAESYDAMSNLPKSLRADLANELPLWSGRIARCLQTADGTEKLLLELGDGHQVESVLLRDGPRRTICISTQVGCAMGCVFCASGIGGVVRNLQTGEIIEQMLRLQRLLPADERLSHIVVMGMGEPLANLDRLLAALELATSPAGLGISARRITISTVGLPLAIRRLAQLNVQYNLAISLHAPDDALRNKLVPVNQQIGIDAILAAADDYFAATGRRLTFEYVLLGEVNDRVDHARRLAQRLAGRCALLNVIPYNPVVGLGYHTPTAGAQQAFIAQLERAGINVQVRQRKGDQIHAACGQLRRWHGAATEASLPVVAG